MALEIHGLSGGICHVGYGVLVEYESWSFRNAVGNLKGQRDNGVGGSYFKYPSERIGTAQKADLV